MDFWAEGVRDAWALLVGGDPATWHAIVLSLWTSTLSVAIGAAIGVPLGAAVGLFRVPGREAWAFLFRVGTAVPTVAIGLFVYALLSRRGPFPGLGHLLYTPWAIVAGEVLLATPILATFTHAACRALDPRVVETARTHGGGRLWTVRLALAETRPTLVAATIAAFGRCITELGIVAIAGGAIAGLTRTLPAETSFQLARGEFGRGVAACVILVAIACAAAEVAHRVSREGRR